MQPLRLLQLTRALFRDAGSPPSPASSVGLCDHLKSLKLGMTCWLDGRASVCSCVHSALFIFSQLQAGPIAKRCNRLQTPGVNAQSTCLQLTMAYVLPICLPATPPKAARHSERSPAVAHVYAL